MRVSKAQMERGVFSWTERSFKLRLRVVRKGDSRPMWAEPVGDHAGALVPEHAITPLEPLLEATAIDSASERLVVGLTRLDALGLQTRLWFPVGGWSHRTYRHVWNTGIFCRLVVWVPNLMWDEDFALWDERAVIRFASTVSGLKFKRITSIERTPDTNFVSAEMREPVPLQGRFLEVIARRPIDQTSLNGDAFERAKMQTRSDAEALWSSIMIAVGDNALGNEMLFDDCSLVYPDGRSEFSFGIVLRENSHLTDLEITAVENAVAHLTKGREQTEGLPTALRWYAHGMQLDDPRDQLLAFFFSIESIVKSGGLGKELPGPYQHLGESSSFLAAMDALKSDHPAELIDKLIKYVQESGPPLKALFQQFIDDHSIDDADLATFTTMNRARSKSVHGSDIAVDSELAKTAQELARELIVSVVDEPGIPSE